MTRTSVRSSALYRVLAGKPVAYHAEVARRVGGVVPGVFLCQAIYWDSVTDDPEGWFYKSRAEWNQETCLSRFEQESAVRSLVRMGLLETRQSKGIVRTMEYRVDVEKLVTLLDKQADSPSASFPRMDALVSRASKRHFSAHDYIEHRIRTETTTETTPLESTDIATQYPTTPTRGIIGSRPGAEAETDETPGIGESESPSASTTLLRAEPSPTVINTAAAPPASLPVADDPLPEILPDIDVEGPAQPRSKRPGKKAPNASQAGYELLRWWCKETNTILAGDANRRAALGLDELLRKSGGEQEAKDYIRYRIGRGWQVRPHYLAEGYVSTWRRGVKQKSLADDRPFAEKMAEMDRKIEEDEERERAEAAGEIEPRKKGSILELFTF